MNKFGNPTSVSKILQRNKESNSKISTSRFPIMNRSLHSRHRFKITKVITAYVEAECIDSDNKELIGNLLRVSPDDAILHRSERTVVDGMRREIGAFFTIEFQHDRFKVPVAVFVKDTGEPL